MRRLHALLLLTFLLAISASAATPHYAAIDLGSKGTKATLYALHNGDNGPEVEIVFEKVINTKLVSSMSGGRFTAAGIDDAASAARQLLADMRAEAAKKKIANVQTYIVGSSGVAKGENKAELIAAVKAATGVDMEFVDPKQEGYFSLVTAVPRQRRATSIIVDIGSGNTKVGCLVGDASISNFKAAEIPLGSVSGRKAAVEKKAADFNAGLEKVIDGDVRPAFASESMDTPCLRNRARIYWTGGAAWSTATLTHPEAAKKAFVALTAKDIDHLLASLRDGSWNQKPLVYHFASDVPASVRTAVTEAAEGDRRRIGDTFSAEDLMAGVSIMKTILSEGNQSATIYFARNSNYIYGYALDKYKQEQAESGDR